MKKRIVILAILCVMILLVVSASAVKDDGFKINPKAIKANNVDRSVSAATTTSHKCWFDVPGAAAVEDDYTIETGYEPYVEYSWYFVPIKPDYDTWTYLSLTTPYPGTINKVYVNLGLLPDIVLTKIDILDGYGLTGSVIYPNVIYSISPNIVGNPDSGTLYAATFDVNKAVNYAPVLRLETYNQGTSDGGVIIFTGSMLMTYKA